MQVAFRVSRGVVLFFIGFTLLAASLNFSLRVWMSRLFMDLRMAPVEVQLLLRRCLSPCFLPSVPAMAAPAMLSPASSPSGTSH